MAQVETTNRSGNSRAKNSRERKALFVDLTPMVDLAFLLIAFFMLTTAMTKPKAIDLKMPAEGNPIDVSGDRLLTVIAGANNTLWYYAGENITPVETNYSSSGLRKIIYNNIQRVNAMNKYPTGLICILKTTDGANYQNLVDLLDEMEITGVKVYAIQQLSQAEKDALAAVSKN